ncbi:MAG: replication-associated recombination protein A [bacterium]|nr:replication-associated recombination protein A [bacterium]
MNLFPEESVRAPVADAPLAWRMRPESFEEFEGQQHLLGLNKPLRRAIEKDSLSSLILYGPPGTGKTALAHLVAKRTGSAFNALNAVTAGVGDIRKVISRAASTVRHETRRTILFVDEIHRFNKVQQDALLPDVERGGIILIGASTENPFFALIPALRSRSQIVEFKPLDRDALVRIVNRALADPKRGLGGMAIRLADEALEHLVTMASGDARKALNALEIGATATEPVDGVVSFSLTVAEEVLQKKALLYDKDGDEHYDTASAFIKSMRGSDPDAAVYYLARMIESGEDPRFIARRIVICASEDVGNADPMALLVADTALRSVERIGMPEARIVLAQAVTYIATAPKSNAAYLAVDRALSDIREGDTLPIPSHLRDAHYKGAEELGRGQGYRYPHDCPGHFVAQEYLSADRTYYIPSDQGFERTIQERIKTWKECRENHETGDS